MNKFQSLPLLAFPFRVFFLLTGLYGVVVVMAWISYLFGGIPLPLGWSSLHWHGHEMLFGLTSAAIAGFVLTAVCNWTGAEPLRGGALLALALLWLAGRFAMWTATWWPVGVVAIVDLLFMPTMAIYLARVLLRHGNKRNLILVALLVLLSFTNLLMHGGFVSGHVAWLKLGELMAFNLITLMMIVIGGRIIPLFTLNWLRNNGGQPDAVKSSPGLDRAALIATALMIPADIISAVPALAGCVALLAALLNGVRLWRWSGWRSTREPLLWILHLGYAWIVVALLLKAASGFTLLPPSIWQHALGVGGMATLILGVMTRVALGHTGRPLTLPTGGVFIYLAISFAAVSRVLAALQWVNYSLGVMLAASGWILAFCLFIVIYWPILSRPRIDGRAG